MQAAQTDSEHLFAGLFSSKAEKDEAKPVAGENPKPVAGEEKPKPAAGGDSKPEDGKEKPKFAVPKHKRTFFFDKHETNEIPDREVLEAMGHFAEENGSFNIESLKKVMREYQIPISPHFVGKFME